ncbi:hypothetical protein DP939_42930 [Spongiactinospora rosea]|uniref:Uncharacterized protein n=2 Tax=Spongiactinospora rosea TaxID=2248750 RepID=A0A366LLJ5_9ACTN|nr:hypothetical protein DP939_42930 [Spongiactinospora rosea]
MVAHTVVFRVPQWRNDENLARLSERVRMVPLPPRTEHDLRAEAREVRLLEGNGNHCDYLVHLALVTKLPDAEIARYYEFVTVEGVDGAKLSGTVYVNPSGSWREGFKGVIVEFFDGGHEAGFDLRCH